MDTNLFIEKAKKIYGDYFDYSKVEYVDTLTKICIICPVHGEFWQSPKVFLQGRGCPRCNKIKAQSKKKKTTEQFIQEAREVHGDYYDYSKAQYTTTHGKVCIICPKHGEFWQSAINHIKGINCPKCSTEKVHKEQTKTNEEFLQECRDIWGERYILDKVNYTGCLNKITVTCREHGDFEISASDFIHRHGCSACSGTRKLTKDTFIEKAKAIYGDRYDYSKVEYINSKTKVCIICHEKDENGIEHGEFWQIPGQHLIGRGCSKCFRSFKKTTEEFIQEANEVHNNKYDYSKIDYQGNKKKVCIICPEHGEFYQMPLSHLQGQGCPRCRESHIVSDTIQCLTKRNIRFETEKSFPWLNGKKLDIYLPDYNIAIECHGKQHFSIVDFFGGEKTFKYQLQRDLDKNRECKENGVTIYYILGNDRFRGKAFDYDDEIFSHLYDKLYTVEEFDDKILSVLK